MLLSKVLKGYGQTVNDSDYVKLEYMTLEYVILPIALDNTDHSC